jgi:hypothetical protein
MSTSYTGKGPYFGMVTTISGSTLGAIKIQTLRLSREADSAEFKDETGQTQGFAFANKRKVLAIEGVFFGTTEAAIATAVSKTPAPGDLVTLTDAEDTEIAVNHTGKYLITRAEKNKSNTELSRLSLEAVQFDDVDVTTPVPAE